MLSSIICNKINVMDYVRSCNRLKGSALPDNNARGPAKPLPDNIV